jgi:hypothetical protein
MTHPTPGPYRASEENAGGGFNIYAGNVRIGHTAEVSQIVASRMDGPLVSADEAKANAVLFAESWNLLNALINTLNVYRQLANSGDCGNWNPEDEPHVQEAAAAIAKATGQSCPPSSAQGENP